MDLSTALSGYIGRNVEVFLENEFYTGKVLAVTGSFITVLTESNGYGSGITMNILMSQIAYIRVLLVP